MDGSQARRLAASAERLFGTDAELRRFVRSPITTDEQLIQAGDAYVEALVQHRAELAEHIPPAKEG